MAVEGRGISDGQKRTRKLELGMCAAITHLIYFSTLPKGTKSTGEKRGGSIKVEQNTHQHPLGGLEILEILPFDPWYFFFFLFFLPLSCLLAQCDIGQDSTLQERLC